MDSIKRKAKLCLDETLLMKFRLSHSQKMSVFISKQRLTDPMQYRTLSFFMKAEKVVELFVFCIFIVKHWVDQEQRKNAFSLWKCSSAIFLRKCYPLLFKLKDSKECTVEAAQCDHIGTEGNLWHYLYDDNIRITPYLSSIENCRWAHSQLITNTN
jgi:hypothetical protein